MSNQNTPKFSGQNEYPFGCQNCHFLEPSKFEHTGRCSKHNQMVLKDDTCKQFFSSANLPPESIFDPQDEQLKLEL